VRLARLEEAGSLSSFIAWRHTTKDNNFENSYLSTSFNMAWSGRGEVHPTLGSYKYINIVLVVKIQSNGQNYRKKKPTKYLDLWN